MNTLFSCDFFVFTLLLFWCFFFVRFSHWMTQFANSWTKNKLVSDECLPVCMNTFFLSRPNVHLITTETMVNGNGRRRWNAKWLKHHDAYMSINLSCPKIKFGSLCSLLGLLLWKEYCMSWTLGLGILCVTFIGRSFNINNSGCFCCCCCCCESHKFPNVRMLECSS